MKKALLFTVLFTFVLSTTKAQLPDCKKGFLVMHYNVENLFDTIDDPHKIDNEFLPDGKKQWNSTKYWDKQQKIAKVISSISTTRLPDIVGLVEIESLTTLKDLVAQQSLAKAKYEIVHHEGPDARGIDCALLYNPKTFTLLQHNFYEVNMPDNKRFKTREIVYAKGIVKIAKDTLHIFVNHWPSRRGGQEESEPKRELAAKVLRNMVDSILLSNPLAKIIIVGDFNDETMDSSIAEVLMAKGNNTTDNNELYNMSFSLDIQNKGTYHYWKTNEWNMLDQMIVSKALLNSKNSLCPLNEQMQIFAPEWLLTKDEKGNMVPFKTYARGYEGGYSDHLPIYQFLYCIPK